jgi:hypothetical protein
MLRVDPKWVNPLPDNKATEIPDTGGVHVTLIDANHCEFSPRPGGALSCLIGLFFIPRSRIIFVRVHRQTDCRCRRFACQIHICGEQSAIYLFALWRLSRMPRARVAPRDPGTKNRHSLSRHDLSQPQGITLICGDRYCLLNCICYRSIVFPLKRWLSTRVPNWQEITF